MKDNGGFMIKDKEFDFGNEPSFYALENKELAINLEETCNYLLVTLRQYNDLADFCDRYLELLIEVRKARNLENFKDLIKNVDTFSKYFHDFFKECQELKAGLSTFEKFSEEYENIIVPIIQSMVEGKTTKAQDKVVGEYYKKNKINLEKIIEYKGRFQRIKFTKTNFDLMDRCLNELQTVNLINNCKQKNISEREIIDLLLDVSPVVKKIEVNIDSMKKTAKQFNDIFTIQKLYLSRISFGAEHITHYYKNKEKNTEKKLEC
ncbi:MAG: hypothetical protein IJF22_01150 [Clostridia bacterium]|nr:hypothetical protein [Clostridia bacterium]